MKHLGIKSRNTFRTWCEAVQICIYEYEHGSSLYLIGAEFYAVADANQINKLMGLHGSKWTDYYQHSDEVLGFVRKEKTDEDRSEYRPKSSNTMSFIKKLRDE